MHALLFAPISIPTNFEQAAKEWLAPHAAQLGVFTAVFTGASVGAADVAATFAPPLTPFDAPV